ncbi:MAG: DUF4125 family protein [Holophaga sp.]|nr:DUF4125 family protein [Holophaga sp.]
MYEPEPANENLIKHIIDLEWPMFHSVKASEPAACQEEAGTFRLMRWMSHSVLPAPVLEAMAAQLEQAAAEDRNLMTEKYALMGHQIPPLKESPLIGAIVAAERNWMQALHRLYPLTFPGTGARFEAYLAADLETWSDRTLELYHRFVQEALAEDLNPVQARYTNLFKRMGYASIEEREQKTRMQMFKCAQ